MKLNMNERSQMKCFPDESELSRDLVAFVDNDSKL